MIRYDNEDTDRVIEARGVGFGQNLRGGWHSRDRGKMTIALTSIDRDTQQRQSFVGAFTARIRDLGDQGTPASITLKAADGSVIDRIRIRGGSTRRWSGNTRTVFHSQDGNVRTPQQLRTMLAFAAALRQSEPRSDGEPE